MTLFNCSFYNYMAEHLFKFVFDIILHSSGISVASDTFFFLVTTFVALLK